MKILIISDIHNDLKKLKEIFNSNKNVDIKIYLGDFQVSKSEQIKLSKKFDYIVMGNCDYSNISPITKVITLEGINIFLTHGHYYSSLFTKIDFSKLLIDAKKQNSSIILHGHDHISAKEVIDGIIRFNPGSPSYPRKGPPSYGLLIIENKTIISLEHIII
ncbi:MAG: YfcE family phosphodiesterase [Mycoplasmataceae bacterium]|nr:YfcE family phosphodiesterase [Mycoplasmataceae bacterium]